MVAPACGPRSRVNLTRPGDVIPLLKTLGYPVLEVLDLYDATLHAASLRQSGFNTLDIAGYLGVRRGMTAATAPGILKDTGASLHDISNTLNGIYGTSETDAAAILECPEYSNAAGVLHVQRGR